ncbi:hypothetical protein [Ectobacillus sp. sgz5001026]
MNVQHFAINIGVYGMDAHTTWTERVYKPYLFHLFIRDVIYAC